MSLLDDYVDNPRDQLANGHAEASTSTGLAMFKVDQVTLPGTLDIACTVVKNNIIFIAVANRKLLRIDLSNPTEILDFEVPRNKSSENDGIYKIHLDDSGQHLVVTSSKGENWYLHTKLSKPARMKVKGIIESIAWNFAGSAFSTKEILLGMAGGSIIETWLEPTEGFNKTVERYSKQAHSLPSGKGITGIKMYPGKKTNERHVLVCSSGKLEHFRGSVITGSGETPSLNIFGGLSGEQEFATSSFESQLSLIKDDEGRYHYAWLSSAGIFHGPAPVQSPGDSSFEEAQLISLDILEKPGSSSFPQMQLSAYHILLMQENTVYAVNRFDGRKVYQAHIPAKDPFMGIVADPSEQTYWLFSRTELHEIVITNESQNMWEIYLKRQDYSAALKYATTSVQTDTIYGAQAQAFMKRQEFQMAAEVFGRTSIPIAQVALDFLDLGEREALRTYLGKKLNGLKKSSEMQRTMLATWILELYMTKLSSMDDLHNNLNEPDKRVAERDAIVKQYAEFINKHRSDLDRDAAYALINSHGRPDELMVFAYAIQDYEYIVNYYIQQDNYSKALELLVKYPNIALTYKTSTVLMPEIPKQTVEMWMRFSNLDPVRLLPAIFLYNDRKANGLHDNQAIRYLHFVIKHQSNTEPTVHNALLGLYARECDIDEEPLLDFLESQSNHQYYDLDFGLRQCKQYERVMSCVHIYSSMGLFDQAVQWALAHDNLLLARSVADRAEDNPGLRKKLWLMIAKKTIASEGGTKAAIELTKKNDVLRIEDLIPHFEDFTVIDDFKDEICTALENYTDNIEALRQEMDDSSKTAENITQSIVDLKKRCAVIHVGEECYRCHRPLLEKEFHVFPCQHTFHSECLIEAALVDSAPSQKRRVAQLQAQLSKTGAALDRQKGTGSESKASTNGFGASLSSLQSDMNRLSEELDDIIAEECLLCGRVMIKSIFDGFRPRDDDKVEIAEAASWRL